MRIWLVVFGDFLAFWVSFLLMTFLRFGNLSFFTELGKHIIPFTILYLSWTLVLVLFGFYNLFTIKPTIPNLRRFGIAIVLLLVVGIFLFYFIPIFGITPKTNLLFQLAGFGILSFLCRRIVYNLFSAKVTRSAILVGRTSYLKELNEIIKNNPQIGLRVISYTNNLHEALEKYGHIKNSVFIFEGISNNIPEDDIIALYRNKTEIIDVAYAYEKYLFKIPIGYVSQTWIIENISTKKDTIYDFLTRIIDVTFSLCVIVLLSPFVIISIIAIYLYDHGPVFYVQDRVGLNRKIFKLYKLRSMIVASEQKGAVWATKNDSRITPIGKIIRRIHLDEMPQMINILKGDLTLVGPRPERGEFVKILEKEIPNYKLRHIIRPGFTGWAQIKYGYANTIEDSREKFEYDLYYIKNRNIFLNLGIVLRTIQIIFTN